MIFLERTFQLLKALTFEGKVFQTYANTFIKKHELNASNIKRALSSLVEKDMIFYNGGIENPYYEVQDKFLMLWLRYK
ncbi:MAG: hypothetical protein V4622_09720 [Bacteroidota bacterium]